MCEVFAAVGEFEARGDVSVLEGVTECEGCWDDGAVVVFAQEGSRAWFRGGGIDEVVREGGARLREAGGKGWWCLRGYGWASGEKGKALFF